VDREIGLSKELVVGEIVHPIEISLVIFYFVFLFATETKTVLLCVCPHVVGVYLMEERFL
jgi:hypothetical protein